VILGVPVSDKDCDISIRLRKRHWYSTAVVNYDRPESTSGPLEAQRREVEEAPNLVLGLELVCPVPAWRYRAVGTKHSILPTVPSLLQPFPTILTVSEHAARRQLSFIPYSTVNLELANFCITTIRKFSIYSNFS
jgi:hypothetical protein